MGKVNLDQRGTIVRVRILDSFTSWLYDQVVSWCVFARSLGRPWGRVKALYRSRSRLPRHSHGGTLKHKRPTPAKA